MNNTKKITKATLKAFVRKHRNELYVKVTSSFNPQTDGAEFHRNAGFQPAESAGHECHTLGVSGIWLVGGSRNSFIPYDADGFTGIRCYNSCQTFIVAIKKPRDISLDSDTISGDAVPSQK